jgi:hypothetical protein
VRKKFQNWILFHSRDSFRSLRPTGRSLFDHYICYYIIPRIRPLRFTFFAAKLLKSKLSFSVPCPTLPYIALHCPTLPYIALYCPILSFIVVQVTIYFSTHSFISFAHLTIDCGLLVAIYTQTSSSSRANKKPAKWIPPKCGYKNITKKFDYH